MGIEGDLAAIGIGGVGPGAGGSAVGQNAAAAMQVDALTGVEFHLTPTFDAGGVQYALHSDITCVGHQLDVPCGRGIYRCDLDITGACAQITAQPETTVLQRRVEDGEVGQARGVEINAACPLAAGCAGQQSAVQIHCAVRRVDGQHTRIAIRLATLQIDARPGLGIHGTMIAGQRESSSRGRGHDVSGALRKCLFIGGEIDIGTASECDTIARRPAMCRERQTTGFERDVAVEVDRTAIKSELAARRRCIGQDWRVGRPGQFDGVPGLVIGIVGLDPLIRLLAGRCDARGLDIEIAGDGQ